jgi:Fe-S cluster assembly ATP-binding protein
MENISLVGKTIASLLEKDVSDIETKSKMRAKLDRTKMGLIITHTGFILDYVAADKGQVLYDGMLSCVSNPREILECVGESGYEECVRCIIENN